MRRERFSPAGALVNFARLPRHHALDHPTHKGASSINNAFRCTISSSREHFNGWSEEGE
jgi:hypothetical protein